MFWQPFCFSSKTVTTVELFRTKNIMWKHPSFLFALCEFKDAAPSTKVTSFTIKVVENNEFGGAGKETVVAYLRHNR
jgi:hypothetical protein